MTREAACDFLVFSDDWGRHPSSCQHLFKHLARDHRVLWVNTVGIRPARPDLFTLRRGLRKLRDWRRPLRQVDERFWVLDLPMLPLTGRGIAARLNVALAARTLRRTLDRLRFHQPVLWTSVPNAADFIRRLDERALVYYVTDDYAFWPGADREKVRRDDRHLTGRADRILAVSEALAETHRTPRTRLLPHGVDFEHFAAAGDEPPELAAVPHPRAAYFGLLYEKIDFEAIRRLAEAMPSLQIVLIGPATVGLDVLNDMPNVHLIGPKPYAELPAWLGAMDVLLLPYVRDGQTEKASPLKFRECLAVGKPIVARNLPDLVATADVVRLYDRSDQLIEQVRAALEDHRSDLPSKMRSRVADDDWSRRAQQVQAAVAGLLADRPDVTVDSSPPPGWSQYLTRRRDATLFHDPRWPALIARAYPSNKPFCLTARRNGQLVGLLALIAQKSRLFGSHLTSLPWFDAAGVLADDPQTAHALCREAWRLAERLGGRWTELRQTAPLDPQLPQRTDKAALRLDLPERAEQLWESLPAKVRNQVRKAQRCGLTVQAGKAELLADFHRVYVRTMRDLGSPPHALRFFRLIAERFADEIELVVIRHGSTPVAAGLTLSDGRIVHLPWAASDHRYNAMCPNMLLYWTMLEQAVGHGAAVFDFGRSSVDSGTYRFKRQWGGHACPLYWHYLLPPGASPPDLQPHSARHRLPVAIWKRLPVSAARWLGPRLIAQLS